MFAATVYTIPRGELKYRVIIRSQGAEFSFDLDFTSDTVKVIVQTFSNRPSSNTEFREGLLQIPPQIVEEELLEILSDLFLIEYVERQGNNYFVFYGQMLDTDFLHPESAELLGTRLYDLVATYSLMRKEDATWN